MPQLNFAMNSFVLPPHRISAMSTNAVVSFFAFNIYDSISINTVNIPVQNSAVQNNTLSISLGLYSISGSTLSLANSGSVSQNWALAVARQYVSFTNTSATQNITPGTWYFGLLASQSSNGAFIMHANTINPGNAFVGIFVGGVMTASTSALPATVATSDLDVTGNDAMLVPSIIISA